MERYLLLFFLLLTNVSIAQHNIDLVGRLQYDISIKDIWGYVDPQGNEYALVGTDDGVSIVSLEDPSQPKEIIRVPGADYTWRDIKTWSHYAYAVSDENGAKAGLLIMDLSDLPNQVPAWQWTPFFPQFNDTLFETHNLWIDDLGYCYLSGSNLNSGGNLILDLFTDPANPSLVGPINETYSHDIYVRDEIGYSCNIYDGLLSIFDLQEPTNPVLLATQTTPYAFTHNAWLSDDSQTVFTTDEKLNASTASYDISDLEDIRELDQFRPLGSLGQGALPHNVFVKDDFLIIGHYSEGLIIVDAAYPDNLLQVGQYDTYPKPGTGFVGCWGAYLWLPSGLVLATDISEGLFVFDLTYQRACYLTGTVRSAANSNEALNNVLVRLDAPENQDEQTDLFGTYQTGLATAGTYAVTFSKLGFYPLTVDVNLANGQQQVLDIELTPRPRVELSGIVVDSLTGLGIPTAKIMLGNEEVFYEATTDNSGLFSLDQVYADDYYFLAGKWGFLHNHKPVTITDGAELEIKLQAGYQDFFNLDLGWTVESTASEGIWERGEPIGTLTGSNNLSSPFFDSPADVGNFCYVTGNTGGEAHSDEVNNGYTRLISPPMDLRGYNLPILEYQTYFFNAWSDTPPNDSLLIWVDNGKTTVLLEEIDEDRKNWEGISTYSLAKYIELTDAVRIIVEASDTQEKPHLIEAAFDNFLIRESLPDAAIPGLDPPFKLLVTPTLFSEELTVSWVYDSENADQDKINLLLLNAKGQVLINQEVNQRNSLVLPTAHLAPGTYVVALQAKGELSKGIKVVKFQN